MIEFEDYDDVNSETIHTEYKLPDMVSNIIVMHDGGRLTISINGLQIFYRDEGTRDCSVEINRRVK